MWRKKYLKKEGQEEACPVRLVIFEVVEHFFDVGVLGTLEGCSGDDLADDSAGSWPCVEVD